MSDGVKRRGWVVGAVLFAGCSGGLVWWDMSGRPWPGATTGTGAVERTVSARQPVLPQDVAVAKEVTAPSTTRLPSGPIAEDLAARDTPKDDPLPSSSDDEIAAAPEADMTTPSAETDEGLTEEPVENGIQRAETENTATQRDADATEPVELAILAPEPRPAELDLVEPESEATAVVALPAPGPVVEDTPQIAVTVEPTPDPQPTADLPEVHAETAIAAFDVETKSAPPIEESVRDSTLIAANEDTATQREADVAEAVELAILAPEPRPAELDLAEPEPEPEPDTVVSTELATEDPEPAELVDNAAAPMADPQPVEIVIAGAGGRDTEPQAEEPVAEVASTPTEITPAAPAIAAPATAALPAPDPVVEDTPQIAVTVEPAPTPQPAANVPEVSAETTVAALDVETTSTAPVASIDSPSFDLVRVDTAGSALIAGRAAPLSVVRILSDGMEIGRAKATPSGEFVAFLDTVPQKAGQVLNLSTEIGELALPAMAPVILLGAAMDGADEEDNLSLGLPQAILKTTDDSVEFIQPVALDMPNRVSLDQISYDEAADVILVGRGVPERIARIYVDDAPRAETRISEDGRWRVDLSDVPAGIYTLRIDEIDAAGNVASRSESPFKREAPEQVRIALLESEAEIVVQPGNNLWTIARNRYGTGFQYHVIFNANRAQIRDPDLIYPGQVFALPKIE